MLSRRAFCFAANANLLASVGRLYLWTFTRRRADDYQAVRPAWNLLLTRLRRRFINWAGIRVYEVHPGQWGEISHGLHVHVICNSRFDVSEVRKIVNGSDGWGRIHVRRIKASTWRYVTKYLWKPRPDPLKGWRLWACFNMPDRSRLADIFIDSIRGNLFRLGHQSEEFRGAKWYHKLAIVARWHWEVVAGFTRIKGLGVVADVCQLTGRIRSMTEGAERVNGKAYQLTFV